MTRAQRDALGVLIAADGQEVAASKRKTTTGPIPCVNVRAVGSLCSMGYARVHFASPLHWSPYTHDDRYSVTDAGRAAWAASLAPAATGEGR